MKTVALNYTTQWHIFLLPKLKVSHMHQHLRFVVLHHSSSYMGNQIAETDTAAGTIPANSF